MDEAEIQAIRERQRRASGGHGTDKEQLIDMYDLSLEDVPKLLDEVERLQKARDEWKERYDSVIRQADEKITQLRIERDKWIEARNEQQQKNREVIKERDFWERQYDKTRVECDEWKDKCSDAEKARHYWFENSERLQAELDDIERYGTQNEQDWKEKAERYRKALEYYADKENYETRNATDTDDIWDPFTFVNLDEGKLARKALDGDSE